MALFFLFAYTLASFAVKAVKSATPNILFILVDDLGFTDLSHNNAEYPTPHIDALYDNGIEFTNYYVNPDCSPTRASIMTGKYSWKTGLENIGTIPFATTQHIPFDTPTMAELLRDSGYVTHGLGKWHLGYAAWNMTPIGRGFDSYFGMFQGEQFYYNHTFQAPTPQQQEVFGGYDFFDNHQVYWAANGTYSTDLYRDRIVSILNNHTSLTSDKPFFIYAAFQTIHTPIESPPANFTACDDITNPMRKVYCNKMIYLDNSIDKIVSTLKATGLYDDTLIALSTDNGGMPYWLNANTPYKMALSWGCNLPYRAGKATLFEGGIKGIGLISGALVDKELMGTQNDILSHCADWLVTFVEGIAQGTVPENVDFDGVNIMDYLGENAANWNRTELYVFMDEVGGVEVNDSLYVVSWNDSDTNTFWKYIYGEQLYTQYFYCNQTAFGPNNLTQKEWLFNISGDPYETTNIMDLYPKMVTKLQGMVQNKFENGGFVPDQDRTVYKEAFPALHDGVWLPWLK